MTGNITPGHYFQFLRLFDSGVLTLTDNMQITIRQREAIEYIIDECLQNNTSEVSIPDRRVMLANFDDVLAQRVNFVKLVSEDGALTLPAYQFVLIPAKEAMK